MKILVTGAHGQLGTELKTILEKGESELGSLPQACQGCQVTAVDSDVLDITDREVVLKYIGEGGYGVVLNCAAMTNVDACEAHEDVAYRVNALGAENLAKACKANGARLVHVSTDYVFSGDGGAPYREDDPTGPLGAYGRTKLAGEKLVLEADPDAVVCRTAWLYGYVGNNFPKKIMKLAGGKGRLKVVTDQKGDPTCAVDLAFQMVTLAASKENGIFHCTCEGRSGEPVWLHPGDPGGSGDRLYCGTVPDEGLPPRGGGTRRLLPVEGEAGGAGTVRDAAVAGCAQSVDGQVSGDCGK
jgi:dTDP-4-dehydrorhamnose reductase